MSIPSDITLTQYTIVSRAACSPHDKHFFDYIRKTFTDTDDDLHFQITNIVILRKSHQKNPTIFSRYFDTAKFHSAPLSEYDYEQTPCSEFIKKRRGTGIIFSPPFIVWDTSHSSAGSVISVFATEPTAQHTTFTSATLGAQFLASSLSKYSEAAPTFVQTGAVFSAMCSNFFLHTATPPPSLTVNSTFHSSVDSPLLNLTSDGKQLSYRSVMRGPERDLWGIASGNELIKLIVDKKTLVLIHSH
jgi:hypothetical protein